MRRLLTVTGPDRPGIIAAISGVLAEGGVDIEDVSMSRLSGNFAMMLVARGGDEAALRARLEAVGRALGLLVHLAPSTEGAEEPEPNGFVFAAGPNRVGIVARLSKTLADHGANITEMSTRLLEKTAVPVYLVRIEATIAPEAWDALARDLEAAGRDLEAEVRLEALERTDL